MDDALTLKVPAFRLRLQNLHNVKSLTLLTYISPIEQMFRESKYTEPAADTEQVVVGLLSKHHPLTLGKPTGSPLHSAEDILMSLCRYLIVNLP